MDRRPWVPCLLVGLLALALHLRTVLFGFVFDDVGLIVKNLFLREPWSLLHAFTHDFWYGSEGYGYYRPIVTASFILNGRMFDWNPAGFHLFNVILHACNAGLLFALIRRRTSSAGIAALVSLLFAVHPVGAWTVSSVVARVDLLPATFILLAWLAFDSPRRGAGVTVLAALAFFLALLCKESAIAFLAIPILGLRLPGRETPLAWRVAACAGILLALLPYLALRRAAGVALAVDPTAIDPLVNPLGLLPMPDRLWAALELSGRYVSYVLTPVRFADPHGYGPGSQTPAGHDVGVIVSGMVLVVWALGILALWIRRERAALPLAFSLAAFLPASNLLMPIGSLYAQNFLYLPLLGLCLAAADMAAASGGSPGRIPGAPWGRRRWIAGGLIVALGALAAGSFREAAIWRDGLTLFSAWTTRFPNYAMAYYRLGLELIQAGRPGEAVVPLKRAVDLDDRNEETHDELSMAIMRAARTDGELQESLRHNRLAVSVMVRRLAEARVWASLLFLDLKRNDEAESEAREALRLLPDYVPARSALAETLFRAGRYDEAARTFEALLADKPQDPDVMSPLVVSLIHTGDMQKARLRAEQARTMFPQLAWFDFCLARIEARTGNREKALDLLQSCAKRDAALREWLQNVDDFKSFRGDPRFEGLTK